MLKHRSIEAEQVKETQKVEEVEEGEQLITNIVSDVAVSGNMGMGERERERKQRELVNFWKETA